MSWLQKLYETYESCIGNSNYTNPPQPQRNDGDNKGEDPPALMPVSHVEREVHIEVSVDMQGNFVRAELFRQKTRRLIPATEDSAGLTSNVAPHPLADEIKYCAQDYAERKDTDPHYDLYINQLREWCESPYGHPLARAVYAYLCRGSLVHDLIEEGVLEEDASGHKVLVGSFISDYGKALVVWRVIDADEPDLSKNRELQQAWISYDKSRKEKTGLCMVRGEQNVPVAAKHPRDIRWPGDGAKLISSKDSTNYTYRGRFLEPEQACTVGYETSMQAHNALRWLIARQGWRKGEQAVVAWAVSGAPVPNPCADFLNLDEAAILADDPPAESRAAAAGDADKPVPPPNLGWAFAKRLAKAIRGYKADLQDTDGIVVMALDSASTGRLSITFYREQMPEQYLKNLEQWQQDCAWIIPVREADEQGKGKDTPHTVFSVCAPTPEKIARVAYGRRVDEKLLKATVERLLPCIVDARPLPRDLVENCVRRACNPMAFRKQKKEIKEWKEVLGVACAMYKGYYARERQKEEYDMALEETRNTRDYLYGRLLAVAEYIERTALDAAGEKNRPTNAERLMQRFADQPYATWP